MSNGQIDISLIIIAGAVVIIGVILIMIGNRTIKRMLRMVGIGVCISAGVLLFIESAELRDILTVLAAIIAVVIAAFSIDQSRQMRKDSIDREIRDRKERLLNEVTEWLRELESHIYPALGILKSPTGEAITGTSKSQVEALYAQYKTSIAIASADVLVSNILKAQYYQRLSSKLDERIGGSVEVIVRNLAERLQLVREDMGSARDYAKEKAEKAEKARSDLMDTLIENADRPLEGLNLSEGAIRTIRFARNARAIRKAILDAVDRVIELRTSLI